MSDLYISWSDYHRKIEDLAVKIDESQWNFDRIVCLARGGLRAGDILSRIFHKPLAILAASSYGGAEGKVRSSIKFARDLTMVGDDLGKKILLVDDLVDSGVSLQQSILWLKSRYSPDIQEIRTAVLWYKAGSAAKPDYYVDYLADNPWIHQPFEMYEKMSAADLRAKVSKYSNPE
ncbi:MAG: phosphoribosyltransferase [Oscillatoriales cyanobacterium]|uniref:Phosphoribosyltransferase family protein n=2 Tax=Microcoleus TaxID=44471 RepID=A0ABU8YS30_9CYAN|nr:MAG: phosphoribosyltransferase [Oscillatoriales cyanobacterium]TAD97455.1 MAG: phosphoribosyltransferase [Oscillatoriales cyanobacterium]TAE01473.1 MAG: phosphoribosyltransferase [Oscillatoriales cyanobacterium]TAE97869.1 MAG: phosphoribosyltransferase [Oscillatoriales cyanobacterium]TAF37580.1 MAG: phosphoribosyltransferase [Oscillatoriales cyanobacterium]